ncbi:uracil-DNA glycosylase family protein [Bacteroides acidifaciens]|uniref:uracil-DNA glycosylase family protein n=1 Tax=Bacteroides acidifaciens TaxID=85831 RepID=UPI00336C2046
MLNKGIYITNAVKIPKTEYAVSKESIEESLPYLERELALFPNVKVIMLMGDVAKKAFNLISKKATKKNAVPSISTYKLRNTEISYNSIRILPSYIMTGQNILIEKTKFEMASEDISLMYQLIMK